MLFQKVFLLAVMVLVAASFSFSQVKSTANADRRAQIRKHDPFYSEVINSLDPTNPMRMMLEAGLRGHGPHYFWMDAMKERGIKHAFFTFIFRWQTDRIVKIKLTKIVWSSQYFDAKANFTDSQTLDEIEGSDFERQIAAEAEARGIEEIKWLMTRGKKRSKLACGTISENLFDDERLPLISTNYPELDDGCKMWN
ncbi:MAG: hypothetical protein K1X52_15640 [Pyrinomonadaceae bacterium]|nr:hypothetical protein [Pyrinomonadaceae bacterium]